MQTRSGRQVAEKQQHSKTSKASPGSIGEYLERDEDLGVWPGTANQNCFSSQSCNVMAPSKLAKSKRARGSLQVPVFVPILVQRETKRTTTFWVPLVTRLSQGFNGHGVVNYNPAVGHQQLSTRGAQVWQTESQQKPCTLCAGRSHP